MSPSTFLGFSFCEIAWVSRMLSQIYPDLKLGFQLIPHCPLEHLSLLYSERNTTLNPEMQRMIIVAEYISHTSSPLIFVSSPRSRHAHFADKIKSQRG